MTVHDHFDGSGHCVECGNVMCRLKGDERAVTDYVRWTLEHLASEGWPELPYFEQNALRNLVGRDQADALWGRAKAHAKEIEALLLAEAAKK